MHKEYKFYVYTRILSVIFDVEYVLLISFYLPSYCTFNVKLNFS